MTQGYQSKVNQRWVPKKDCDDPTDGSLEDSPMKLAATGSADVNINITADADNGPCYPKDVLLRILSNMPQDAPCPQSSLHTKPKDPPERRNVEAAPEKHASLPVVEKDDDDGIYTAPLLEKGLDQENPVSGQMSWQSSEPMKIVLSDELNEPQEFQRQVSPSLLDALSGGAMQFNNGSTTAPVLDKVLEGLWTPNSPWQCTRGSDNALESEQLPASALAWEQFGWPPNPYLLSPELQAQWWMMQQGYFAGMPHPMTMPPVSSGSNDRQGLSGTSKQGGKRGQRVNDVETSTATTVMLKNIPNRYTRQMLVDRLNDDFRGKFDFLYLPIDFQNRCNMGYAFINFRTPGVCADFMAAFNGISSKVCLPGCNSTKVCDVSFARLHLECVVRSQSCMCY